MQDAARPLLPLAPQPAGEQPTIPVVVPKQLQSSSSSSSSSTASSIASAATRGLLPLQPKLQLTPAHLTAAIAVVAAQPVTPSPRPAPATTKATKKPLKLGVSRTHLVLPAPLKAAATTASGSDDSPVSPSPSSASTQRLNRGTRKQKKCSVAFCESYARSRGLCKAHGGGKRCKRPGCEVSDQGGGFCIRHGGGKRCLFEGCDKSAQSRHYCKAHGGGARCLAVGCEKSSQGGGLCRAHGGGPRRKRMVNNRGERVESPRSKKRTKYRAQMAARTLMGAAQAIAEHEAMGGDLAQIACEPGSTALSFKIRRPVDAKMLGMKTMDAAGDQEVEGSARQSSSEDHATHMFVAASLLGMQTATAE